MTKTKRIIYISIIVILTAIFILLAIFMFSKSYLRLFETLADFGHSVKFYFCELFSLPNNVTPTVRDYSQVIELNIPLPENLEGFNAKATEYFSLLINRDNFKEYGIVTGQKLGNFAKIMTVLLPLIVALYYVVKMVYRNGNTKHDKDTLPLKMFKHASKATYQPIKRFILSYMEFVKAHSWIWICWAVLWSLNLNLVSIVMGFLAYYFYFTMSFQFGTIYVQFCKLIIDLQVIVKFVPWWGWLIVGLKIFEHFRRKIAMNNLRHFEAKNCGFINELPIVSITCGSMGKK